jgi:hypothetical protein
MPEPSRFACGTRELWDVETKAGRYEVLQTSQGCLSVYAEGLLHLGSYQRMGMGDFVGSAWRGDWPKTRSSQRYPEDDEWELVPAWGVGRRQPFDRRLLEGGEWYAKAFVPGEPGDPQDFLGMHKTFIYAFPPPFSQVEQALSWVIGAYEHRMAIQSVAMLKEASGG